jgi:thiosulfate reductase cytochrome b subunit
MAERIFIFKRFERFWHWSQALLIIIMMVTGFEVHGFYTLFGFESAAVYHTTAAWLLLTIWAFAVVWQFTTGEWRQYIPSLRNVDIMLLYYLFGIFTGASSPFHKTTNQKHNPLQRLAYLAFLSFMSPIVWISGLLYLFYPQWPTWGLDKMLSLEWVALIHTFGAFLVVWFFIVHVYLALSGPFAHFKAMITGWEDVE